MVLYAFYMVKSKYFTMVHMALYTLAPPRLSNSSLSAPFHEVPSHELSLTRYLRRQAEIPISYALCNTEMALSRLPPLATLPALSGKLLFRLQISSDPNTLLNTKLKQENLGCINAILI